MDILCFDVGDSPDIHSKDIMVILHKQRSNILLNFIDSALTEVAVFVYINKI